MEKPRPSTIAWGVLAGGVAAYEYFCPQGETLSENLDPHLETIRGKVLIMGAVGVTALHLCNLLDQRIDPYHRLTTMKRPRIHL